MRPRRYASSGAAAFLRAIAGGRAPRVREGRRCAARPRDPAPARRLGSADLSGAATPGASEARRGSRRRRCPPRQLCEIVARASPTSLAGGHGWKPNHALRAAAAALQPTTAHPAAPTVHDGLESVNVRPNRRKERPASRFGPDFGLGRDGPSPDGPETWSPGPSDGSRVQGRLNYEEQERTSASFPFIVPSRPE